MLETDFHHARLLPTSVYHAVQVKPHNLVSATAYGNRMFIISLRANSRQWKKHSQDLLAIMDSFDVLPGQA